MEKYGAITCPKCNSAKVKIETGQTKIAVVHDDLVKEGASNLGEEYRCLDCSHKFEKVTNFSAETGRASAEK